MKLLNLKIFNLFDVFTHKIKYNQDERITIITAPNGYGKTMTLKIIYNLFNKKFNFFIKLIFNKIVLCFDNNKSIEIIKELKTKNRIIKFILKDGDKEIVSFEYPSKKMASELRRGIPSRILEEFIPNYIERITADKWLNTTTDEVVSFEDILYQYNEYIPERLSKKMKIDIPKELLGIINSLEVYFIQEQRLLLREPVADHRLRREVVITDTIEKYSHELSNQIKQTIGEYAQVTQFLDSSFPKRLFKQKKQKQNYDLKEKLTELQEQRQKTSKYGLLKLDEDTFFQEDEIDENDTKVLSLYISDSEKKLAVLSSLVNKIELFTEILNERRFNFKSIEIDKDRGFIFKAKNDSILQLTELSSGEQHEVVLLFELIFKTTDNSLVLIDEPEISLHVVWQKEFLNDIKEIIKLQNIDIIIATHSPQIINERWDLTVNLEASKIE